MSDFEIKGLEEFEEKLRMIEKKAPDRILIELDKQGNYLRREVRKNTPEKSGKLKKSYKLEPVEKIRGGYSKGFRSNSPHFGLVERGHRIVSESGKDLGWADGAFMVEKTVAEQETPIMNNLQSWLDKLFKELK